MGVTIVFIWDCNNKTQSAFNISVIQFAMYKDTIQFISMTAFTHVDIYWYEEGLNVILQ